MEIAYLMAGKRIQAKDVADLNRQLEPYQLISNLTDDGFGDYSARRISEPDGTSRYYLTQSVGDPADIQGYDLIVGKSLPDQGDIIEVELSDLEATLQEVEEDIPDAKIIAGSYWS